MKTKISFLAMIFSLSILSLSLSSCEWLFGPPLTPPEDRYDPNKVRNQHSENNLKPVPEFDDFSEFENILDSNGKIKSDITLAEALEKIEFQKHPDWRVAIKAFTCIRSGQTLVVHDPGNADLDFYDSDKFAVYWFKNGKPVVRNVNYKLECVCKGKYAAIVINRTYQTGVGIAFYSSRACPVADNHSTIFTDQQ